MKFPSLLLLPLFLIAVSCNDDDSDGPDTSFATVEEFFEKYAPPIQEFTIFPGSQQVITAAGGTIITIEANSLWNMAGNVVTDSVLVKVRKVATKGEMIYCRTSTQLTNEWPLETGGMVYLQAYRKSSGETLRIDPNMPVTIFVPDAAPQVNMSGFLGSTTPSGDIVWVPDSTRLFVIPGTGGYILTTDTLNWYNIDKPVYANPWVTITVDPQDSIQDYDTRFYLAFQGRTLVTLPSSVNIDYTYCPTQSNFTVIAVGLKNGQLYSAFLPVSTALVNKTVSVTMSPETEEELKIKIDNLP